MGVESNSSAKVGTRLVDGSRTGGRMRSQAERRERTRAAIVAAARGAFRANSYFHTTIEDILEGAGVSRATFYMYFESKSSVAAAVFEEAIPDWFEVFDKLLGIDPADFEALREWVTKIIHVNLKNRDLATLAAQLVVSEADFDRRYHALRDAVVQRLATAGLRAGVRALQPDRQGLALQARIKLFMLRLDELGRSAGEKAPTLTPSIDIYIEVVALELQSIIRTSLDEPFIAEQT